MSTSFFGDITHIPFMNTSTTGMCVLQTTDEVDIGGHYNSTLEQGQCSVLTVLTLPQTAPEPMSNVGHSRAAIGQSEGRCPLTCTGHSRALVTHVHWSLTCTGHSRALGTHVHWAPTVSHTTWGERGCGRWDPYTT